MPANSTHADYDAALPGWIRARDLLAGEDAVKASGAKYLPRLDGQTDEDYLAYQSRARFSNATRRAADAFVGLVFRKAPFVKIHEGQDWIGKAMARFSNDADNYHDDRGFPLPAQPQQGHPQGAAGPGLSA